MLPDAIDDPWFARWKATQAAHLDTIKDAFGPLPVLAAELAGHELSGLEQLSEFGRTLYGALDPSARLAEIEPLRVDAVGSTLVLSVHLPFTERDDVGSAAATRSCSSPSVRTGARSSSPTACCGARSRAPVSTAIASKWSSCDRRGGSRRRPRRRTCPTRSAHFWKAAHELLAAARVVIDAADGLVDEQMRSKPEAQPRVRRIDVDER